MYDAISNEEMSTYYGYRGGGDIRVVNIQRSYPPYGMGYRFSSGFQGLFVRDKYTIEPVQIPDVTITDSYIRFAFANVVREGYSNNYVRELPPLTLHLSIGTDSIPSTFAAIRSYGSEFATWTSPSGDGPWASMRYDHADHTLIVPGTQNNVRISGRSTLGGLLTAGDFLWYPERRSLNSSGNLMALVLKAKFEYR